MKILNEFCPLLTISAKQEIKIVHTINTLDSDTDIDYVAVESPDNQDSFTSMECPLTLLILRLLVLKPEREGSQYGIVAIETLFAFPSERFRDRWLSAGIQTFNSMHSAV